MTTFKRIAPVVDEGLLATADAISSAVDAHITDARLTSKTTFPESLIGSRFSGFVAERVRFSGVSGEDLDFTNGKFIECDFANVEWRAVNFDRVEFIGCRLTGADLSQSSFRDVILDNSNVHLAHLKAARMHRVRFSGSRLTEASFQSCAMKKVLLESCDIQGTEFSQAKFEDVTLASCANAAELRGLTYMKGVTVSDDVLIQLAPVLAALQGIEIIDND